MSEKPTRDSASDGLPDRLRDSASSDYNKPDFRELDLGSPVSPLRTRLSGLATTTTTNTSSSSSSSSGSVTGRVGPNSVTRRPESGRSTHSGDLSGSSGSSPKAATRTPRLSQARSDSGTTQPLIYSGGQSCCSSATSPAINVLPAGNILPPGRVLKTGMATSRSTRSDVLGSGTGTYGHGSIMRGTGNSSSSAKSSSPIQISGSPIQISGCPANVGRAGNNVEMLMKKAISSSDPEEVKRIGNEMYKKGNFAEALRLYDRAIMLSPKNAACRSNRAAALTGLNRIGEAIKECEEALRLDPNYGRAHQRLASLFIRMGQIESAGKHLRFLGNQLDPTESRKLQAIDTHLSKCAAARQRGDWRTALKESDAAIASGADFSPQLVLCKVEALVKLNQLDDAKLILSEVPKVEPFPVSCSLNRFSRMLCEAYLYFVKSQIDMALGR